MNFKIFDWLVVITITKLPIIIEKSMRAQDPGKRKLPAAPQPNIKNKR